MILLGGNFINNKKMAIFVSKFLEQPYKTIQDQTKEGARSSLFSDLSKSGIDNYVIKRSKRPLLEEIS